MKIIYELISPKYTKLELMIILCHSFDLLVKYCLGKRSKISLISFVLNEATLNASDHSFYFSTCPQKTLRHNNSGSGTNYYFVLKSNSSSESSTDFILF